jgi:hypothetical protein
MRFAKTTVGLSAVAGASEQKHETKKQVFRRKRLLKVEKSSFLHPFFCFGKKG